MTTFCVILDTSKLIGTMQLFLSDTKSFFSKNYGWPAGMGERNGRWAMVIDKDGTVTYADNESNPSQVTVRTTFHKEVSTILIET